MTTLALSWARELWKPREFVRQITAFTALFPMIQQVKQKRINNLEFILGLFLLLEVILTYGIISNMDVIIL